jgi:hypothetical protein
MTSKTVIFAQPFVVNEAEGEQLPGIYTVETEEESLDLVSIPGYRRVSTVMHCHASNGMTRYMSVDPNALAAALARDVRAAD